jgi:carboxyl-terminal processing protease
MSLKSIVALLVISLWPPAAVAASAGPPSAEEQQRVNLESFDHVWTTIRDKHWDPEMAGLDWEAVRDELRPRVEQATDREGARAVMDELISRLGLSHYAIIPAEAYAELDLPDGQGALDGWTGLDVRVVGGRALVTSVAEGSPAAEAGIRPGWGVLHIDDDDVGSVLETIEGELEASRYLDLALAGSVLGRLSGPVGEEITVSFLAEGDRSVEAALTLSEQRGQKIRMGYLPPIHVWIDARTLDATLGYIAFNMFVDPGRLMPVFNEAMGSFMESDGLVIDLRGNPGGLPAMIVFPRPETYSGPVAVLVDGLSGSCSEILAGGLKDLGRARIFGTRTMGAALPSVIEKLPNGDGFQYAFANYVSEGGEVLEGVGVIPHFEIAPSREALLAGRDPVLDAAVAWIRQQRPNQEENTP